MFKELKECKNIDELKKVYKKLAKIHHPDMGGNEENFKELNNLYQNLLSKNEFNFEIDIDLERVIADILYLDITIEIVGSWIWLSGDTKPYKEILKTANFRWHNKRKKWFWTNQEKSKVYSKKDFDSLKEKYGCKEVKTKNTHKIAI